MCPLTILGATLPAEVLGESPCHASLLPSGGYGNPCVPRLLDNNSNLHMTVSSVCVPAQCQNHQALCLLFMFFLRNKSSMGPETLLVLLTAVFPESPTVAGPERALKIHSLNARKKIGMLFLERCDRCFPLGCSCLRRKSHMTGLSNNEK